MGFDWERLRGLNVLAINRSAEKIPFADVLWWTDARFWRRNEAMLMAHAAPWKATCDYDYRPEQPLPPAIHVYRFTGKSGFDPDPGCLRTGNNSTFAAMHLAAHLGVSAIVLLGVDMKFGPNGESHFHDGHGLLALERTLTTLMLPMFKSLKAPLADRGISVLNANPDSALTVWPCCSIEEGLAEARRKMK